ncbi:MAG: hypothetical protein HYU97_03790 [Deltaproteobacteria bacterium]|nr:hypothetical protein [Deltaproteobacteria bacterium]
MSGPEDKATLKIYNFRWIPTDFFEMDRNKDMRLSVGEFLQSNQPPHFVDRVVSSWINFSGLPKDSQHPDTNNSFNDGRDFLKELEQRDPHRAADLYQSILTYSRSLYTPMARSFLSRQSPTPGLTLLSDTEGRITHLLIVLRKDRQYDMLEPIKRLLQIYPKAKITILSEKKSETEIRSLLRDELPDDGLARIDFASGRFAIGTSESEVHDWPQDPIHVIKDRNGENVIIEASHQDISLLHPTTRPESLTNFADVLAEHLHMRRVVAPFDIDGGNVVTTPDEIFVGIDEINRHVFEEPQLKKEIEGEFSNPSNIETSRQGNFIMAEFDAEGEHHKITFPLRTREAFMETLKRYFGDKKIVFIDNGKGNQAIAHIDTFFHPLPLTHAKDGKPFVLVGNPQLAERIIQAIPPERLERYRNEINAKGGHYFKSLLFRHDQYETELQSELDQHAQQLELLGYHVIRVPYHPNMTLSYTNSLFEHQHEGGENIYHVTMPSYGIDEMDHWVKELFTSLGFEVNTIDLRERAGQFGALRCSVKVLNRT